MKKMIIICTIMVMALAMAMPCFAATIEEYSYNGVVLPKLPVEDTERAYIGRNEKGNYYFGTAKFDTSNATATVPFTFKYNPVTNAWEANDNATNMTLIWSKTDISENGVLAIKGTDYVVKRIVTAVESSDFVETMEEMAKQLNLKNAVELLALGATAVVGLVFMWWGVRKLTRAVFSAFRKGKISV